MAIFLTSQRDGIHRVVRQQDGKYPDPVFAFVDGTARRECRLHQPAAGTLGLTVYVPAKLSPARADEWFQAYTQRESMLCADAPASGLPAEPARPARASADAEPAPAGSA